MNFDRHNTVVVSIATALVIIVSVVCIAVGGSVGSREAGHTERVRITACASIANVSIRAFCIQGHR